MYTPDALTTVPPQLPAHDDTHPDQLVWNPLLTRPVRGLRNPANVFLGQHTGATLRSYHSRLQQLASRLGCPDRDYEWLNWQAFDLPQVRALVNQLKSDASPTTGKPVAPSTINGYLSLIKCVLRNAAMMHMISPEHAMRVQSIRAMKVRHGLAGRMATPEEKRSLFEWIRNHPNPAKRARDHALLALLFYLGLRRHEPCQLTLADLDVARELITVRGKGGSLYELELLPFVKDSLINWIEGYRGDEPGPLFYRVGSDASVRHDQPLSPDGVAYIMREVSEGAGLKGADRLRPHDARRTYGSELIDITDLKTASELMRHENINQTGKYDRRKGLRRRAALERLV
jgi:integrase